MLPQAILLVVKELTKQRSSCDRDASRTESEITVKTLEAEKAKDIPLGHR